MLNATPHMGCLLQWTPCISGRWRWRWSEQEAGRDLEWMDSKSVSLAVTELVIEWGKGWLKRDVCRGMVFGEGWGAKDFISHKVPSGWALTFHYYIFKHNWAQNIFFSKSHVQKSTVPAVLAVPDVHKLCHCSTVQLFQPICPLLHTCTHSSTPGH